MAETLAGPGDSDAGRAVAGPGAADSGARRLSELRVVELRAELRRRNLDTGGNKSALRERLQQAVKLEEGKEPDETGVALETTSKRTAKRYWKGQRTEEEGLEDNGLEEDSRDAQEGVEAGLEAWQPVGAVQGRGPEDAEAESGGVADVGADGSAGGPLRGSREYVAAPLGPAPAGLAAHAVQDPGSEDAAEASSLGLRWTPGVEAPLLEPENEKILDILGETCKSEPVKEEGSELEQPFAQETSSVGPDRKLAEEEDLFGSTHPEEEEEEEEQEEEEQEEEEEGDLDLALESTRAQWSEADTPLAVVKREPVEQTGGGARTDCEPVGLEKPVEQSSAAPEPAEAPSQELADAPPEAPSPEPRDSKEDVKKFDFDACNEVPPAPKESSTREGADQKMSSFKEERDIKPIIKDEKAGRVGPGSGRNLWVSGLSPTTRAADLKSLFSKYGKVVGAKVVANARSPGARCYGFITMATSDEATQCISHLHRTELHGRMISVEKARNEPAGRRLADRKPCSVKEEAAEEAQPASGTALEVKVEKTVIKKEEKMEKKEEKRLENIKKEEKDYDELKPEPADCSRVTKSASRGVERTVVMDKCKGEPVISVKTTSEPEERSSKSQDRQSESKEKRDILSFDKIKERRERERQRQREREIRETERRRERERRERERLEALPLPLPLPLPFAERERERGERARLQRERAELECQRQRLRLERGERARLERERLRVERARRKEQERIARERQELRRQQERLRAERERRPALRRPYELDGRREDTYWPEGKRAATGDRCHPDAPWPDYRFHELDPHDRGPAQGPAADRREGPRPAVRDGQCCPDGHHGRDPRDGWGCYGTDRRTSEARGPPPPPPPPPRGGQEWLGERQLHTWQDPVDAGAAGREHVHWQGAERSLNTPPGPLGPGHAGRSAALGRGGFPHGGHAQGHAVPGDGLDDGVADQDRVGRVPHPHPHPYPFTRRY